MLTVKLLHFLSIVQILKKLHMATVRMTSMSSKDDDDDDDDGLNALLCAN